MSPERQRRRIRDKPGAFAPGYKELKRTSAESAIHFWHWEWLNRTFSARPTNQGKALISKTQDVIGGISPIGTPESCPNPTVDLRSTNGFGFNRSSAVSADVVPGFEKVEAGSCTWTSVIVVDGFKLA